MPQIFNFGYKNVTATPNISITKTNLNGLFVKSIAKSKIEQQANVKAAKSEKI